MAEPWLDDNRLKEHMKKRYLWVEVTLVFIGLPLVIYLTRDRAAMITLLWGGALFAFFTLRRSIPGFTHRAEWNLIAAKTGLKPVLKRFYMLAVLLCAFTLVHDSQRFLSFPIERPATWLMVMILYPILSVWPQEILYRSFFMRRYEPLLPSPQMRSMASALLFSYAHIAFNNWVALLFTLVGGYMFAETYRKHRSLALVCFEHAIYGCFIFTIGLGWYFYGSAWKQH